jgi:hypothetical protein
VEVRIPERKRVTQVTVLTPDSEEYEILQFKESGKHAVFTVPKQSIYGRYEPRVIV